MNVNTILRKLGAKETTKTSVKVTRKGNYLIKIGKFFEVCFTPSGKILWVENTSTSYLDNTSFWDRLTNLGIETTKIELTFTLPPVKVVRKIWRNDVYHTEEHGGIFVRGELAYQPVLKYRNDGRVSEGKELCGKVVGSLPSGTICAYEYGNDGTCCSLYFTLNGVKFEGSSVGRAVLYLRSWDGTLPAEVVYMTTGQTHSLIDYI